MKGCGLLCHPLSLPYLPTIPGIYRNLGVTPDIPVYNWRAGANQPSRSFERNFLLLLTLLFLISKYLHIFTHAASPIDLLSSIRRHALQPSVTDAVPLPNLHGSKVQLGNKLGLLVQILLHASCLVDHD